MALPDLRDIVRHSLNDSRLFFVFFFFVGVGGPPSLPNCFLTRFAMTRTALDTSISVDFTRP